MIRFLMVLVVVLLAGGQPSFAQKDAKQKDAKTKKSEKKEWVKKQLESGRYEIEVDKMSPRRGNTKHLSSDYSLKLRGDSVISYLPYYGRVYSAPYGGSGSLDFTTLVSDYKLTYDKKGKATIKFNAKTDEDTYAFVVNVFENGSASVSVSCMNRQSILFYGELDDDD